MERPHISTFSTENIQRYRIMVQDKLGKELKVGDKCLRPHVRGNSPELCECEVVSIDPSRAYGDVVEVLTQGNMKTGWTYPRRLVKIN